MRNKIRAVRRSSAGEVATCDLHLPTSLRGVTSPTNGDDNDTHLVVRRLSSGHDVSCNQSTRMVSHAAAWVLIPQAVLR